MNIEQLKPAQIKNAMLLFSEFEKSQFMTAAFAVAGVCIIGKESNLIPRKENDYSRTGNDRIRKVFRSKLGKYYHNDEALSSLKTNPVLFFDHVYGGINGNRPGTHDGSNFIARGFNQITFRPNYRRVGKGIGVDLVKNPELLLDSEVAARAAIWFYWDVFSRRRKDIERSFDIDNVDALEDVDTAIHIMANINAGIGKPKDSKAVLNAMGNAMKWKSVVMKLNDSYWKTTLDNRLNS